MQFTVAPTDTGHLTVDGCAIAHATWNPPTPPDALPILLVHGAAAHMGWWDTVIAELAARHRVVALELSGNGDSGWRPGYDGQVWSTELLAVAHEVVGGPCLVVGHSLGGRVAIVAAARDPDTVLGPVLVDTPVRPPGRKRSKLSVAGPRRSYDTLEDAIAKFGTIPVEPVDNDELFRRVAAGAFRQVDGQWTLKADQDVFGRVDDVTVAESVARLTAPLTLIYGDRSGLINDALKQFLTETHAGETHLIAVPGGYHHLTFDHGPRVAELIESAAAAAALSDTTAACRG